MISAALYTARSHVLETHMNLSYPLLSWHFLTYKERLHPPEDFPLHAAAVAKLLARDPETKAHFAFCPVKLNDIETTIVLGIDSEIVVRKGLPQAGLDLVRVAGEQLLGMLLEYRGKREKGEPEEDDDG